MQHATLHQLLLQLLITHAAAAVIAQAGPAIPATAHASTCYQSRGAPLPFGYKIHAKKEEKGWQK